MAGTGGRIWESNPVSSASRIAGTTRVREHFSQLLRDSFGRDLRDQRGHCLHRGVGGGIKREIEPRSESYGTEQAEFIFPEAGCGVTDRAKDFSVQVFSAADVVDDRVRERIEEHSVDGEIAT